MNRREFSRICSSMLAGAVATGSMPVARAKSSLASYPKSQLFGENKQILTPSSLEEGVPYLFFYPYISTPCFLIDLGVEATGSATNNHTDIDGDAYQWRGGVGPNNSIVAYSAICTHKMTHPAREVSFINYRHDKTSFHSRQGKNEERAQVISCCSERSVYDPLDGARVLAGPAPKPLAAIQIDYDATTGALYAIGSYGGDMYERFFDKFGFRAAIEHKVNDPKQLANAKSPVKKLSSYSGQIIKC